MIWSINVRQFLTDWLTDWLSLYDHYNNECTPDRYVDDWLIDVHASKVCIGIWYLYFFCLLAFKWCYVYADFEVKLVLKLIVYLLVQCTNREQMTDSERNSSDKKKKNLYRLSTKFMFITWGNIAEEQCNLGSAFEKLKEKCGSECEYIILCKENHKNAGRVLLPELKEGNQRLLDLFQVRRK